MSRRRCGDRPRRSLLNRIRYWLDFKRRRFDRELALLDMLGGDEPMAGAGVREPRRPLPPSLSGGVALDLPED